MKIERHAKIIELIHQYEIETQEELAARLHEAGYSVTQATISRDIRELNLTKVAGRNGILIMKSYIIPSRTSVKNIPGCSGTRFCPWIWHRTSW